MIGSSAVVICRILCAPAAHCSMGKEGVLVLIFVAALWITGNASSVRTLQRGLGKALQLPPGNFDFNGCLDDIFDNAQVNFNNQLGIDANLTWKNATTFSLQVDTLIKVGVDSFVKVCNARQQYAQKLGFMYPSCINRFYLLNRDATDFDDAVTYVHTFKHLEFLCSTGFDVFQYQLPCIVSAENEDGSLYQACFYKFQQTSGWVQCEKERIGFAYDCPGLSC
ncbi:hypothetical protein TELCIR_08830 [Teladorsagia circumcincta]|uniref:Uncharacterized protein n=1 Tax=Teladorsagia circumcincta TaxID=45464 RepID=A0A2G9UI05_TELCI|nr:hypothetical protein TELCIR_08830 [Teladorsagia circumcincta]